MPACVPIIGGNARNSVTGGTDGRALRVNVKPALQFQVIKIGTSANGPFIVHFKGDTGGNINGFSADLCQLITHERAGAIIFRQSPGGHNTQTESKAAFERQRIMNSWQEMI